MPNVKISDLTNKAAPVLTDELEIQETAGGSSYKATVEAIFGALIHARGRVNSAGTLQTGEVGIASVNKSATGQYDYTLDSAVSSTATAQILADASVSGAEINAAMTSTTVCRVNIDVNGVATDADNMILILKEG